MNSSLAPGRPYAGQMINLMYFMYTAKSALVDITICTLIGLWAELESLACLSRLGVHTTPVSGL